MRLTIFVICQRQSLEFSIKQRRNYMHSINLAHQLIVTVTVCDDIVRSGKLLHVGHIIVLDKVDNFHDPSKIVS